MSRLFTLFFAVLIAAWGLSSCQSSKIAYGNSYYFKQTPKAVDAPAPKEKAMVASVQPQSVAPVSAEDKITQSAQRVAAMGETQATLKTSMKDEAMSRAEKRSIKQEARVNKRQMRREMKTLVREYKAAPKAVQEKMAEQAISGNTRTGLIVGIIGIVLLIVSGATGAGAVLYTIGSILVLAGLILILLDLLD